MAASRGNHHLNWNTIIYSRYKQMHSVLLYGKLNLASYKQTTLYDSCLQRLKVKLREWDWLDEGKNNKVSQSEAELVGYIPFPTWDATDDSQIPHPPQFFFFTDLHYSREWPISRWKWRILPKGDKFASLLYCKKLRLSDETLNQIIQMDAAHWWWMRRFPPCM